MFVDLLCSDCLTVSSRAGFHMKHRPGEYQRMLSRFFMLYRTPSAFCRWASVWCHIPGFIVKSLCIFCTLFPLYFRQLKKLWNQPLLIDFPLRRLYSNWLRRISRLCISRLRLTIPAACPGVNIFSNSHKYKMMVCFRFTSKTNYGRIVFARSF